MRVAVIGAGGVGGYFGARLQAAGAKVTFIQRGAHLGAMRESGLRITSPLGDVALPEVVAREETEGLGPQDVVLVCVKSGDTEAAAAAAKSLLGPDTAVISLQNGVENEDRLAAVLGPAPVMGGVAYMLSLIAAPGMIAHSGTIARILFGERDGRPSARGKAFLDVCVSAGIDATLTQDIDSELWAKFIFLCPHNGMTALTRLPIGPIRDEPETREMLAEAAREVIAVARAREVPLAESVLETTIGRFDQVPWEMTSSMHYDVTHAKPLELDWLNGAVVRMGRALGIPTPVNQFIYTALKLHRDGSGVGRGKGAVA